VESDEVRRCTRVTPKEFAVDLEIRGLCKTYPGGVRALHNVDLSIPTGMFGLLGPNGAGKSTLMRTIATLQDPDSGTIKLGEIDALRDKDSVRRHLGYLPQDFGVYPTVTAEALLDHFAVLKGINQAKQRREIVKALLERTNLYHARKQKLGGYSGGMRQRFGIAQALLGQPKLIIVDEPTAGLDPEERNRFHNLLSELGENIVVLLSTHIVEDVRDLCTRMAILCGGQVLQSGAPQEAIDKLRGQVWKRLIDRRELEAVKAEHNVIFNRLFAGRIEVHILHDTNPGPKFETVEPDLEDVYFTTLTKAERGAKAA